MRPRSVLRWSLTALVAAIPWLLPLSDAHAVESPTAIAAEEVDAPEDVRLDAAGEDEGEEEAAPVERVKPKTKVRKHARVAPKKLEKKAQKADKKLEKKAQKADKKASKGKLAAKPASKPKAVASRDGGKKDKKATVPASDKKVAAKPAKPSKKDKATTKKPSSRDGILATAPKAQKKKDRSVALSKGAAGTRPRGTTQTEKARGEKAKPKKELPRRKKQLERFRAMEKEQKKSPAPRDIEADETPSEEPGE